VTDHPAPDDSQTARWTRREPLLVLLSRMQRGVLLAQERDLLRAAVETELADGDHAHERADSDAGWKRAAWLAEKHDQQALRLRRARQQRNETREQLAATRRGEAEAVRAREAAERDRDAAWREAGAARIRSGRNIAEARRNRDAWRNARRRAAMLSAEVTRRAPLLAEYAERTRRAEQAANLLAGSHRRAEQAEATLTAVREAVALAVLHEDPFRLACPQCATDHLARIEAALGDPQPATEPEPKPEHGWEPATCRRMNTRTCPPSGPCPGPCARLESDDPTPWGKPAEPVTEAAVATDSAGTIFTLPNGIKPATPAPEIHVHVNVTPQQVADAVRRVLREDRAHLRDLLR
jgi:hypothetical protein